MQGGLGVSFWILEERERVGCRRGGAGGSFLVGLVKEEAKEGARGKLALLAGV